MNPKNFQGIDDYRMMVAIKDEDGIEEMISVDEFKEKHLLEVHVSVVEEI